ncbi:hypothetical protein BpJC7_00860 [Weizmannia acidilactici]|uniref:Uncharacterized protein n=2 Tax=Heyndrickxia TaxID=2837504 RepID=A0A5J4JA86_9BACI|nr:MULTISPECIES: hypothetical protein [Heyndrickxia]MDL5040067.1 hypothetical protein [Heyndrickxia coagulans]GER66003.1 hypothetical protein BpJC4_04740 [Weizmannia acidilactici]GER68783.1 hypothetical protein BpJC7_00860 [Weizmannia acidilactici]GER72932.1 hypothetical protein BpPP18_09990 [Weizmannia acidilactici]
MALIKIPNDDFKKIPLSENQVREILHSLMQSFETIDIQISEHKHQELTKDQVIDLLVRYMSWESILEFITQLNIIRRRGSNALSYVKYILTAVLQRLERSDSKKLYKTL